MRLPWRVIGPAAGVAAVALLGAFGATQAGAQTTTASTSTTQPDLVGAVLDGVGSTVPVVDPLLDGLDPVVDPVDDAVRPVVDTVTAPPTSPPLPWPGPIPSVPMPAGPVPSVPALPAPTPVPSDASTPDDVTTLGGGRSTIGDHGPPPVAATAPIHPKASAEAPGTPPTRHGSHQPSPTREPAVPVTPVLPTLPLTPYVAPALGADGAPSRSDAGPLIALPPPGQEHADDGPAIRVLIAPTRAGPSGHDHISHRPG